MLREKKEIYTRLWSFATCEVSLWMYEDHFTKMDFILIIRCEHHEYFSHAVRPLEVYAKFHPETCTCAPSMLTFCIDMQPVSHGLIPTMLEVSSRKQGHTDDLLS